MEKTDLVCLPFAGGDEYAYAKLYPNLTDRFNIIAPKISGKGSRLNTAPHEKLDDLLDDVHKQILEKRQASKVLLYGHSMGGLLIFLLAHKLHKSSLWEQTQVAISGLQGPPFLPKTNFHGLPNDEFIKEVLKLGGLPKELLNEPKLLDFYTPILKNDFKLFDSFVLSDELTNKLPYKTHIIAGSDEAFTKKQVFSWDDFFLKQPDYHFIQGDHFFIFARNKVFCNILSGLINYFD